MTCMFFKEDYNNLRPKSQHSVEIERSECCMKVLKLLGVTLIIVVPMILGCTFLSGKSRKFMDKLSGKNSDAADSK